VEGEFSRQRLLLGVDVMVVLGLEFDRWHVPGGAVQAGGVEPVDPVQQDDDELARIIGQWHGNQHRAGLTDAEQTGAVEQLAGRRALTALRPRLASGRGAA
jgi:hypothetical protein